MISMCECSGQANSRGYSRPEHFARHGPAHRSDGRPPEDQRERIVEPYDGLGARPFDIADVMLVARENPRRGALGLVGARGENIRRGGCSVRFPEERIELHEGHVERAGQPVGRHAGRIIASVDRSLALWQDRRELESRGTRRGAAMESTT